MTPKEIRCTECDKEYPVKDSLLFEGFKYCSHECIDTHRAPKPKKKAKKSEKAG